MIILKNIEVAIDIQNPMDTIVDEDNIMEILRKRYEGKCYAGCYIVKILKILRQGECVIEASGHPSFGTMPLCFSAEVQNYGLGEIINNCKVKQVNSEMIVCDTETAAIILKFQSALKSVRVGQIISVRVKGAKYRINSNQISVSAIPFVPGSDRVYKINADPGRDSVWDSEAIKLISGEIAEVEKKLSKQKAGNGLAYDSFKKILYAREKDVVGKGSVKGNIIQYRDEKFDFGKYDGKYITRATLQDLTAPNFTIVEDPNRDLKRDVDTIAHMELEAVVFEILFDYYSYIKTLSEYIEIYSTKEILENHKNLWLIYKKNREKNE